MTAAFVAVTLIFGVFTVRLVQLQGLDSSRYATMAASERLREHSLPAIRGTISDTNSVPLATTVDAVDVIVDQVQLTNPAAAALQLAGPLDRDPAELQAAMTGDDPYVPLQRTVPGPVWSQIRDVAIKGVYAEPSADRAYPAGTVAGSVLGFTGDDGSGLAGVEVAYEDVLAGQPGWVTFERDSAGRTIPLAEHTRVEPVAGRDLRLTIDRDIQWYTEQVLAHQVAESEATSGSAAVLDPTTGALLALATVPTVDPGQPDEVPEEDRGNRAIEEAYEPGSVQKVLTLAAAVDSGAASIDDVFTVPGSIQRADRVISDFPAHPEWQLTLAGILARSSNVGSILAAEKVGSDRLREYLARFGYGSLPGLGLPGETPGLLPEDWTDLQRDTISFGQGVATTIVHLAGAYGAIANDGVRMPVRLVDAIVDEDGVERPVPLAEPVTVVSPQTARDVTTMMEAVMGPDGSGTSITVDGYRLAGKSGTAEQVDPDCGCYNSYTATFAGFAPADDPALVVVVSIQDPTKGRYGTSLAGPVFADILSFSLPRLGVAPSGTPAPGVAVFADE